MAIDWEALENAFAQAVGLPDRQRADFVAGVVEADPELGAELSRLLSHDKKNDEALSKPIAETMAEMVDRPLLGQVLGAYVIVETVATGGMGTVYRGRRNDAAFEQDVAIKVMSQFVASEENLQRFRSERQILAQLSHPYIAEMFDGGTTDLGLPYIVMEYIRGAPIDQHCREHQLSDRHRIELFLKVCEAVSLSHQNLIVHRDIKPSNVLISSAGVPKLLDFGIAKPLNPAHLGLTTANSRAMTPEYASPEQIRGEAVTTQTDIYALGLLLYRILSDKMPYETTDVSSGELEKAICESAPAPLTRTPTEGTDTPRRLRLGQNFAADLNTIVMCALQKDPARRYPSVSSLMDDVHAYLANEPISARPDSTAYRAKLFYKRHRLGTTSAAIALISVVAFANYSYQQAAKLAIEKTTAERSMEFLTGMFRAASPSVMNGQHQIMPDMKISDMLTLGEERIHLDLADQPRVQARLLAALGTVYGDRGDTEKAIDLTNRANALLMDLGESPELLAESLAEVGWLYLEQTRYRAAESTMTSAYDLLIASGLSKSSGMIKVATDLAVVKARLADFGRAQELYAQALEIHLEMGIPDPMRYAVTLHNQALAYRKEGRYPEFERGQLEAHALFVEHLPSNHPNLAASYDASAGVSLDLYGDVNKAEQLYHQTMEIDANALGKQHPEYVQDLLNYALLLETTGRLIEAEIASREALETIDNYAEADYEHRAIAHIQLAEHARLVGDLERAKQHLAEFNEVTGRREMDRNKAVAQIMRAKILVDEGKPQQALELLHSQKPTGMSEDVATYQLTIGRIARQLGRSNFVSEAIASLDRQAGLTYFDTLARDGLRAYVEYATGDSQQGITALREVLAGLTNRLPPNAPMVIETQLLLATWLENQNSTEAVDLLEGAHNALIASGRESHQDVATILAALQRVRQI